MPPTEAEDGAFWLDTRGHTLKQYSTAQEQWAEVTGTRLALRGAGIGVGFRAGDGVRVSGTGVAELEGICYWRRPRTMRCGDGAAGPGEVIDGTGEHWIGMYRTWYWRRS